VDQLARGLIAQGHHVTLFATGDSTSPAELRFAYPEALGTEAGVAAERRHVEAAYGELSGCDIIHDHTLLGPLWAAVNRVPVPVVTTAHGPFVPAVAGVLSVVADHVDVVAISEHQRRSAGGVRIASMIHHGVDLAALPFGPGGGGYVAFLGRMSPEKGAHRAIAIARAAGRRIVLAAKLWEAEERRYFRRHVEPLLGPDAVYVGAVGPSEKVELLGRAEALVNPIAWPEPFGLVMIEALACGTPVVAFDAGSAPEIVEHGRTGFVCRDEGDAVARLGEIGGIDRRACRASVAARFTTERMVADHVALYRASIARRRASRGRTASDPRLDRTHLEAARWS
jgi:glycosyltransferase involved in cell wall biosynthesis